MMKKFATNVSDEEDKRDTLIEGEREKLRIATAQRESIVRKFSITLCNFANTREKLTP